MSRFFTLKCFTSVYHISHNDRPEVVAEQDLVALHQALMTYVQTEFVEGSAELGLSCRSGRMAERPCIADIPPSDFSHPEQILLYTHPVLSAAISITDSRLPHTLPHLSRLPSKLCRRAKHAADHYHFTNAVRDSG